MSHRKLMLTSLIIVAACAPAFGDWTYNPGTGHWYRLTAQGTWDEAEAEAVKQGGHLVTINDAPEQDWLINNLPCPAGCALVFIGLHQLPGSTEPAEGWVWISGDPSTYRNWRGGEPNDGNICAPSCEQYAEMHCDSAPDGEWNDIPITGNGCDTMPAGQPGIIEREIDPAVPAVSEWGLVVLTLLTLVAGTIILVRPRYARV